MMHHHLSRKRNGNFTGCPRSPHWLSSQADGELSANAYPAALGLSLITGGRSPSWPPCQSNASLPGHTERLSRPASNVLIWRPPGPSVLICRDGCSPFGEGSVSDTGSHASRLPSSCAGLTSRRSAVGTVDGRKTRPDLVAMEGSRTTHPFAQDRRRYLGFARPSTTTTLGSLVNSFGLNSSLLERLPPPITTRA